METNDQNAGSKGSGFLPKMSETERKLRLAMEVARIGYWKYDCATQQVEWSEGHEKLFGIDIREFKGNLNGVQDWVHPDDRAHGILNLQRTLHEKVPFDNTYRVVQPNGKVEWLHSYGYLSEDLQGNPEHVFGITRNMTHEKEAESRIQYESGLRKLILEISARFINIPLPEVNELVNEALRKMGTFVEADRAYIFTLNTETTICSNTYEWCAEGISPEINNLQTISLPREWIDTFCTYQPVCIFDVPDLKEGYTKEILASQGIKSLLALPMLEERRCIGFVGFDSVKKFHNYSDTEQQLLQVFADVLINIKLRQQAEEELIAAKEAAEAGNRIKTAFLQNISHELRTPLNGILGFGELIAVEELDPSEKRHYLTHLQQNSNRLIQTISNYLDMAQLTSSNYSIENVTFSLSSLLKEVIQGIRPESLGKHIKILSDFPDDAEDFFIFSDRDAIRKVVLHLTDNAVKFTKEGSITLGFKQDGSEIELFVRDTGRGIEPHALTTIFHPFHQGDTAHTRGYEGSGLGLAIVKALVEKLGGDIRVESEVGKGSLFRISFPWNYEVKQPAIPKKRLVGFSRSRSRILVADDDLINTQYMETLLSLKGYQSVFAANGLEAVDIIRKDPAVDLVLMDIRMPVMDGLEATREILMLRPELPVIALTAYVVQDDIRQINAAGCRQYLSKPVLREQLMQVLAQFESSSF